MPDCKIESIWSNRLTFEHAIPALDEGGLVARLAPLGCWRVAVAGGNSVEMDRNALRLIVDSISFGAHLEAVVGTFITRGVVPQVNADRCQEGTSRGEEGAGTVVNFAHVVV